ncbi:hypothetical protein Tco_0384071, partial [Tanacetum coccineum]
MSTKDSDKKQEEIVVVRDFPEVFPDDVSGLPRSCRDNSRNSKTKLTVKNRYPLPRIDDLFDQLQ